ncbi:uncharacterized protein LOC6648261 isoform X2 [Drosophila willistoni]|uniref:uncharacterized protein LOC6648261 isoform X2 n=1 Tax=Drosophila willistoni TaxID=7260 RepID=UPI001F0886EC|nr:uncharacterized protein LOC6648261 isoform X2 [Drosophila willistoni]
MAAIPNSNDLHIEKMDKEEQRARLIRALGKFKPQDANPLQFYNCVREFCIMHNCSIDEGMDRAIQTWPTLSMRQRALYNSQRHAELPIPVPRHLIYRAFQMERNGRWSLGRAPVGSNGGQMYTVESYKPPQKISKLRAQLTARKPKYDNLSESMDKSATQKQKKIIKTPAGVQSQSLPGTSRRVRTLTPPELRVPESKRHLRRAKSISNLLSVKSNVKLMKTPRRNGLAVGGDGGDGGSGTGDCPKIKRVKSNKRKTTKRKSTSNKKNSHKDKKQLGKDKKHRSGRNANVLSGIRRHITKGMI